MLITVLLANRNLNTSRHLPLLLVTFVLATSRRRFKFPLLSPISYA
jgi:hypothetical protein